MATKKKLPEKKSKRPAKKIAAKRSATKRAAEKPTAAKRAAPKGAAPKKARTLRGLAALVRPSEDASLIQYFVLIEGPTGNPPQMRIRDFSPDQASACRARVRVVDAFPFQTTAQTCNDGPICRAK